MTIPPDTTLRQQLHEILIEFHGGLPPKDRTVTATTKLEALCQEIAREARLDEAKGMQYHLHMTGDWNPKTLENRIAELSLLVDPKESNKHE